MFTLLSPCLEFRRRVRSYSPSYRLDRKLVPLPLRSLAQVPPPDRTSTLHTPLLYPVFLGVIFPSVVSG